jgi:YbbR domain-containing protein
MPSGVTLSSASSNSIEVYVDEKVSASIEVRPSVIYSSEYTVGEYELDYDVITVSGPKKYVDEVGYAEVSVNAGKITSTTTLSGALSLKSKSNIPMTSPYLSLSRSEVKVTIPVFVTKEVEVRVPYKHGFYTEGTAITRVEPSTVTIEGDPAALSKVDYIYTTMVDEKEVDESLTLNLALQIPDNVHLSRSEKGTVNVSIQHKGTEKKRLAISSKRFEVVGADAVNYDILSDSLTISVRGKSEVLKALKEDSFKVIIDLTGYDVESAIVDVPYTVEFETESYKAYVIGSNDDNIKVKIG